MKNIPADGSERKSNSGDDVCHLAELVRANPPRARRVPQTQIQKYLAENCPQHFYTRRRPVWVPLSFYGEN